MKREGVSKGEERIPALERTEKCPFTTLSLRSCEMNLPAAFFNVMGVDATAIQSTMKLRNKGNERERNPFFMKEANYIFLELSQ